MPFDFSHSPSLQPVLQMILPLGLSCRAKQGVIEGIRTPLLEEPRSLKKWYWVCQWGVSWKVKGWWWKGPIEAHSRCLQRLQGLRGKADMTPERWLSDVKASERLSWEGVMVRFLHVHLLETK